MGMAVRAQHVLLPRRLLPSAGHAQMVADPAIHAAEGRVDRRRLHAHGLGAAGAALCNTGAAPSGAGVRGHHGPRVGLHAPCQATVLFARPLIPGNFPSPRCWTGKPRTTIGMTLSVSPASYGAARSAR